MLLQQYTGPQKIKATNDNDIITVKIGPTMESTKYIDVKSPSQLALSLPPSIWFSHDCCPHQRANLELLEHRPHVGLGERGVLRLELDHVLFTCCDPHCWQLLVVVIINSLIILLSLNVFFTCFGISWEKNNWSLIFEVRIIFLMLTSSLIPKKSITLLCSASSVVTKTNITSPL